MNLEGLIPIAGGIYMLLLATGAIPSKIKNPEKMEAWLKKYGSAIKILSPIIILFGILQLIGILK